MARRRVAAEAGSTLVPTPPSCLLPPDPWSPAPRPAPRHRRDPAFQRAARAQGVHRRLAPPAGREPAAAGHGARAEADAGGVQGGAVGALGLATAALQRQRCSGSTAGAALTSTPPPPLPPLLPQAVHAAGHPIALITGRRVRGGGLPARLLRPPAREAPCPRRGRAQSKLELPPAARRPQESERTRTAANLAAVGYGGPCNGTLPGVGPPCYAHLVLRAEGDDRLASIYKPQARRALMDKHNYTIHAGFGDQFSDINGENPPTYAFKVQAAGHGRRGARVRGLACGARARRALHQSAKLSPLALPPFTPHSFPTASTMSSEIGLLFARPQPMPRPPCQVHRAPPTSPMRCQPPNHPRSPASPWPQRTPGPATSMDLCCAAHADVTPRAWIPLTAAAGGTGRGWGRGGVAACMPRAEGAT
jgi:hypothetical protein